MVIEPPAGSGPVKRQSRTSQVVALSLGKGFTAFVSLLSAVVLSRLLTKGEYATYRQAFLVFAFVAPFLGLGIHQGVFYFLAGDGAEFRRRLGGAAAILGMLGLAFGLFLVLGGNRLLASRFNNEALIRALPFLLPYFPLCLVLQLLDPAMVTLGRANQLAAFNVLSRLLIGITIIGTCVLWRNPYAPVGGNVVASCTVAMIGVWIGARYSPAGSWAPTWGSIRQLLAFSVPLGLASMAGTATVELGKVIVSSMSSPDEFAVYINGAIEVPLVGIITGSVSSVLTVELRRALSKDLRQEAIDLFRRIASKTALFILPTMFFLFLSADWFVQALFSREYAASAVPLRIYLLLLPIRVCYYGPLLIAAGRPQVVMYRALVGLVLTSLLTVVLVKHFGYVGAAVAAVIVSYSWSVVYNLVFIAREFRVPFTRILPFADLGRIAFYTGWPAAALGGVSTAFSMESPLANLLGFGAVYWFVIAYWWNHKLYDARSVWNRLQSVAKR